MSIINDQMNQMASSNCITTALGCYPYYPQPVVHSPKKLEVEAVDGGYIISGTHQGKGPFRTVAIDAQGLAAILKKWAAQFETKAA